MRNQKVKGKRKSVRPKVDWKALEVIEPDAAGIDVGGQEHWVAISPERDAEPVRSFGCFTADIHQMADWLVEKGVRSVAMQSTGVYWMPVLEILEQRGDSIAGMPSPVLPTKRPWRPACPTRRRCAGTAW